MEGYNNEGFLYINNSYDVKTPFKKGEIKDSDGNLICIGENVSRNASLLDEDYAEYMQDLKFWTPLLRGIKIRIYWYAETGEFNISTSGKIYPKNSTLFMHPLKINEQINYELLDPSMCYYAILERNTQKVILTHIVKNSTEVKEPALAHLLLVKEDKAFRYHLELRDITPDMRITEKEITIEKNKQENGVLFIRKNGAMIEVFNNHYSNVYMLEKPDYIEYVEYYIYALNKHPNANETDFENYFEYELHYDINNEILVYFPEYKEYFEFYKMRLKKYIEKSVESGMADSEAKDRNIIAETLYLDIVEPSKEIITEESTYIDVYELIKNADINPLFTENENDVNKDMKKIKFASTLIEAHNLQELIEILG